MVPVQPEASVASTGKGLRYIGTEHCYAYSGTVSVDALEEMLAFTTGSGYILGHFELHGTLAQIGQSQIRVLVTLNSVTIIDTYFDATVDSTIFDFPTEILLPPLTETSIQIGQASGSNKDMQLTFVGRVYGTG